MDPTDEHDPHAGLDTLLGVPPPEGWVVADGSIVPRPRDAGWPGPGFADVQPTNPCGLYDGNGLRIN